MRARNREINIFNMSLLDILTGMLGAFLFLMIGLVPYYAKVMSSQLISAEDKAKFDELKKLLDKGLKGPLSPEEAEQLRNELNRLQSQVAGLQDANQKLQNELTEAKQQLDQANKETAFWASQDGTVTIASLWDSDATDVDVFVRGPKGSIFGPKDGNILGSKIANTGFDSHSKEGYRNRTEGLVVYLTRDGPGDYLVFYRIPPDAAPASYQSLMATYTYHEVTDKVKGLWTVQEAGLDAPHADRAKPGGMYAWAILSYDQAKRTIIWKPPPGKLPEGIANPQ